MTDRYRDLRHRLLGLRGVIVLVGAPDTGKSRFAARLLEEAVAGGRPIAYVDADVGRSTVGPPACVGLRFVASAADLDTVGRADDLRFVGSTSPQGVVLPHVVATASLVEVARRRMDLVLVETTGVVGGVVGQTLKYHLAELIRPTVVVVFHRGAELEPVVGMLRRFLDVRIEDVEVEPDTAWQSPVERRAAQIDAFTRAFAPPLQRWRVQPTVFAPTLPEEFDLSRLDGMLVGVQDANGRCLGLGALEFDGSVLRVLTNCGEEMRGLRLGSMRIDTATYETSRVRLRQLIFGI